VRIRKTALLRFMKKQCQKVKKQAFYPNRIIQSVARTAFLWYYIIKETRWDAK